MDRVSAAHALFYIYSRQRICQKSICEVIMMATDEFRPDVGKNLFAEHQTDLLQALRQLAGALGHNQFHTDLSQFFSDFMRGFWDPYEEVCIESKRQQEKTTMEIRAMENLLKVELSPDLFSLFSQYSGLVAKRNNTVLDYAFLVGYQCAFRLLLMGLSPVAEVFQREEEEL